jgi:hypothetical protein
MDLVFRLEFRTLQNRQPRVFREPWVGLSKGTAIKHRSTIRCHLSRVQASEA